MSAHSTKNDYLPSLIKTSAISAKRYATILTMLLGESSLKSVLHAIVRLIEEKNFGSKSSILLLSSDGKRLLKAAAPSISDSYNNAINGIEIGPKVGSCGAAAFLGQRVIVEDIASHENWAPYRELPLSVGLKSCWSEPILSGEGEVLGSFAMYYEEVKAPRAEDLALISEAALLASLAIERDRSSRFQRLCGGIFNQMPLALLITDAKGTVLDANPSFFDIMHSAKTDLAAFEPHCVFEQSSIELAHLFEQIRSGNAWHGELIGRRADDESFYADVNVTVFKESEDIEYSYAWIFSDITDKKSAAETIHYQAKFDPLTQLVNRPHLFEKIEQQINMSKLNPYACFSFILMDLDNFKQINDSLGHKLGDEVLIQVAERIKACMGKNDVLGRLGGDEFALIIPDEVCPEVLSKLVQQLNQVISQEYLLDSHQRVFTRLSAGISRFPQDACSLEQLLNCADQALFCAKEQGRNQFHFFNDQMQSDAERTAKLTNALKLAIENDAFELHYQPIVCAKQHKIRHVEALVRWRHDGRLVRPDEFIPAAEASGLIIELGRWVRVEAMKTLLEFEALGLDIGISINVSTFEFWSHDLQDCLINSITETATKILPEGFPFHKLTLEITESLLMKEQVHLINSLSQLRELGIKIAIDDFGTGYSSLSYLSEFPVDIIKIDKSFIRDVNDKKQAALVSAVVALSRALNLDVTVEGVESHLQLAFVSEKEVDSIQGYFFHKPLEKTALLEVITKH
ncbi:putative bifunctional diguanylate cyclase/phosphodiesterase [Shewanella kaireitica]|uniref:putative bifunctional diguanylate cyclase/phosphodiesterase n=1 Tax=Shewanella kaireitica TaxID=212021 RepID=UPI00200E4563|nr:EAL domain-containing protein [Shewanella kaireitica]MCL1093480.1 EAL domain-containing protein [Shewanella kaireitica]